MFIIRTLQQRLIVFLVLPVAVFLVAIGVGGYFYIRNTLYQQWQQAAILRLQRAAHEMEMRLNAPQQWIKALAHTGGDRLDTSNQEFALKKVQEEPGVSRVILKWEGESAPVEPGGMMCLGSMAPRVVKVSPVRYFYPSDHQTLDWLLRPGERMISLKYFMLSSCPRGSFFQAFRVKPRRENGKAKVSPGLLSDSHRIYSPFARTFREVFKRSGRFD